VLHNKVLCCQGKTAVVRTAIGRCLGLSRSGLAVASAVGASVVTADLALVWGGYPEAIEGRGVLAVVALAAHLRLTGGDLASVGLHLTPSQGWRWWVWVSLWIGLAVAACIVVGLGLWVLSGQALPIYATPPRDIGRSVLRMCVFAAVLEEVIYRLALCVPLAVWLGPWRAIVVSGVAFAGLHVAGGNPSPENLVGGLFLAWAYLKSESIVVPIVLHSLGNLCALAGQVGTWYWLGGAA
jgi:membrane protease YdiL (CAAX protease family)